jgi:hypothetical protein
MSLGHVYYSRSHTVKYCLGSEVCGRCQLQTPGGNGRKTRATPVKIQRDRAPRSTPTLSPIKCWNDRTTRCQLVFHRPNVPTTGVYIVPFYV